MANVQAVHLADEWLMLRPVWHEVAEADRAAVLFHFRLSAADLMAFDRDQLIVAYEALD